MPMYTVTVLVRLEAENEDAAESTVGDAIDALAAPYPGRFETATGAKP